ncbi:hypothetical protein [Bradyrhizobium sp. USDA 4506]
MGWIKRHWALLLGLLTWLQPLGRLIKWGVERGGDIDFLISRWSDPGWVGAVIGFILSPPPWMMIPLMIAGAILIAWDYYRHRTVAPPPPHTSEPPPSDDKIFAPTITQGPAPLLFGLYVADIGIGLKNVQSDHHGEIRIRLFNGTGHTFDIVSLTGSITFKAGNVVSSDPQMKGELPTPIISSKTPKSAAPQTEWSIVLDQRFPSKEADKIPAILRAHPLHFDLSLLDIQISRRGDLNKVDRLQLWDGIKYERGGSGTKSRV